MPRPVSNPFHNYSIAFTFHLLYKAYPPTYHGTTEAELLGKSVFCNQFDAGLEPGLHKKLTGVDGNFEELVCKARFEEAMWKETSAGWRKNKEDKKIPKKSGEESEEKSKRKRGYQCHCCGSTQHFIRDCPFKGRGASREAKGTEREAASNIKNLSFSSEEPDTTEENNSGRGLAVKPGPRVTTTVEVNGVECAITRLQPYPEGIQMEPSESSSGGQNPAGPETRRAEVEET